MGKVLHRKADQMRYRHWDASFDRRLHGQWSSSASTTLRDHDPKLARTRQRQSCIPHIQRLPDDQHRTEAAS